MSYRQLMETRIIRRKHIVGIGIQLEADMVKRDMAKVPNHAILIGVDETANEVILTFLEEQPASGEAAERAGEATP